MQKKAVNYDNMILKNAIQQIEYLKREVDVNAKLPYELENGYMYESDAMWL